MSESYPAGSTILIPVSLDTIWEIIGKTIHRRVQNGGNGVVAPPRKRPSHVASAIRAFVRDNPGRYCTREILQQHPNLKAGSIKSVLFSSQKKGEMRRTEDGKWYATS